MVNPKTKEEYPVNPLRCWAVTVDTFQQYYDENRIIFPGDYDFLNISKPVLRYWKEDDIAKAGDNFGRIAVSTKLNDDIGMSQNGTKEITELFDNKVFSYPKPSALIKFLLSTSTSGNDIILDFFSGSATTAHAVMRLNAEDGGNRQFICVQLPEVCDEKSEAYKAGYKTICEIGKERIRRAGKELQESLVTDGGNFRHLAKHLPTAERKNVSINDHDFNVLIIPARWSKADESEENAMMAKSLDIGFKVFKLDTSNIKLWDGAPVNEEDYQIILDRMNDMIDSIKDDRTDMDVVYEIMLKMGVPLTYRIMPLEIDGVKAYSVGEDGLLMVCLDAGITTETIEQLADYAPAKIVIAESCFADVSAMRNAHYVLRDRKIELKLI